MLTGRYKNAVNENGRVCVPAKMRDVFQNKLMITRSLVDKCLVAYPMEKWQEFSDKIKALPQVKARAVRRRVFGNAEEMELDPKGRMIIPQELMDYAELSGEVVFLGNDDFAEIWNADELSKREALDDNEDTEALLEELGF